MGAQLSWYPARWTKEPPQAEARHYVGNEPIDNERWYLEAVRDEKNSSELMRGPERHASGDRAPDVVASRVPREHRAVPFRRTFPRARILL